MKISLVVLTKNNAGIIRRCLGSVKFADEIIVIDNNSVDDTVKIAVSMKAKVFSRKLVSFAAQRNFGLTKTVYPWVLMLDSDEVITPELAAEIKKAIQSGNYSAYRVKRLNYFFGRPIKHGGYWPDWQTRLFKKTALKGYGGAIHESPDFSGPLGDLSRHLVHYSHNNLRECLEKSIPWTRLEAEAFIKAKHPPVTWWRLIKVMVWEFSFRYFKKMAFLDGYVGFVESLIQAMNRFYVYQQIWELQQHENRPL